LKQIRKEIRKREDVLMNKGTNEQEKDMNTSATSTGNYASVNGLQMYYEIHGKSREGMVPLVLLHGSISAIGTSFGQILPRLSLDRQVIAIEQQAHGHTADIDRPLSIEQMADDTVALLQQIGVDKADFFGYSLGSGIAMYIAIKHPEVVRKLVLAGGVTYNREGFHPGMLEGIESLKPEFLIGSPFYDEYMQIAPRPEDFPRLIEKVKRLNQNLRDWSPEEIRSIRAPTMIMIGDSDIVRPEHDVEMFRLLGGGVPGDTIGLPRSRLAILPATTHVTLVQRADWLSSMIDEFLDAPMPE
jgi:pimeloyl-ACP methyl ester carboxylesterase